jgi:hypothetical protein
VIRRRLKPLPMPDHMGPSEQDLATLRARQAMYDDYSEAERKLIADYGMNKALAVLRLGRGTNFAKSELIRLYGPPIKPKRRY